MQYPNFFKFRASPVQAKAIELAAKDAEISVSEFLRQAVEDRLAKVPLDKIPPDADVDPFSLLSRAGRGSLPAQRELARLGVQMACSGKHDARMCFVEAMIFARLAAAHGHIADQGLVIAIAALMGELVGEEACEAETAEALARIAIADEAGFEPAADALQQLIAGASPRLAALVQEYCSRIRGLVAEETD